jgi:hypothetical protein
MKTVRHPGFARVSLPAPDLVKGTAAPTITDMAVRLMHVNDINTLSGTGEVCGSKQHSTHMSVLSDVINPTPHNSKWQCCQTLPSCGRMLPPSYMQCACYKSYQPPHDIGL